MSAAVHTISRQQARAAGKLTDTLVSVRDEYAAKGQPWVCEALQAVIDLPTPAMVDLADSLGIGGGVDR